MKGKVIFYLSYKKFFSLKLNVNLIFIKKIRKKNKVIINLAFRNITIN